MIDPRIDKLADVLVNYSVAVKPGDTVYISGETLAEPLLEAVFRKTLEAGGHPWLQAVLPRQAELLLRHASDQQLEYVHEPYRLLVNTFDASIYLNASANTKALSNLDPRKLVLHRQARSEISRIVAERTARGDFRWTLTIYPTDAFAQDAEMSLAEYADFCFGACLPDLDDPVGYWRRFSSWQQQIVDWLKGKEQVRIVGPDTDLSLSVAGRTFINADGRFNMPDGEVFTGPVEDSVNGHVSFSYPAIHGGREVTGVRLFFDQGRVVQANAQKNQDYLFQMLDADDGARYVGEFAIGTNQGITRFTRQILFDEKIGGSFHLALGQGYPETGSQNTSAIHWDMICDLRDGGEIWVDGEVVFRNGRFVIQLQSAG
jgi:aminopeptidase